MFGFLQNLIPPQFRLMAYGIAAAVLFAAGSATGYATRDYFADRKEIQQLEANVKAWQSAADNYKVAMARYRGRAILFAQRRQENQAQGIHQASTVDPKKLTTIEKGKCDAQTNSCSCERTARCHWLQLNAAYSGTAAPAECALGVPDSVQGEQLPPAPVGREGNGIRSPGS